MEFTIKLSVNGAKAVLTEMPFLAEGTKGVVSVAVGFDESWDAFSSRYVVLARDGETGWKLPLDSAGTARVPAQFTASEMPFTLAVVGETADTRLTTNEVCAAFVCTAHETAADCTVYAGPYTLVQNGVYPLADTLLTDDLTVDVPNASIGADTSSDTVTPETLHEGVTAHDASGEQIVGTYVNPYNANTENDTVTAGTLLSGYTAHNANGDQIEGVIQSYNGTATDGPTANAFYGTWQWNAYLDWTVLAEGEEISQNVNFTSGGKEFTRLAFSMALLSDGSPSETMGYGTDDLWYTLGTKTQSWVDGTGGYRTMNFGSVPQSVSEECYDFIVANAVYRPELIGITSKDGIMIGTAGKYVEKDIKIKPNLQTKTITENGTYAADNGYAGFGEVTVSCSGSGEPTASVTFNAVCSETEPADTSKLWVKTGISPQKELYDLVFPEWLTPTGEYGDPVSAIYFDGFDDALCSYNRTDSIPKITVVRPDGTSEVIVLGEASSNSYDWQALDACAANGCYYVLLGYASSTTANRRELRLLTYNSETAETTTVTLNTITFYEMRGGLCVAEDGTVYFCTKTKTENNNVITTSFYYYKDGLCTRLTEDSVSEEDTRFMYGYSGMELIDGKLYTVFQNSERKAYCVDIQTKTVGYWQTVDVTLDTSLKIMGKEGNLLKLSNDNGLSYADVQTGTMHILYLYRGRGTGYNANYPRVITHSWRIQGDTAFVLGRVYSGAAVTYAILPRKAEVPTVLFLRGEKGLYCDPVGEELLFVDAGTMRIRGRVASAVATDAQGYWHPVNLYRYTGEETGWTEVKV